MSEGLCEKERLVELCYSAYSHFNSHIEFIFSTQITSRLALGERGEPKRGREMDREGERERERKIGWKGMKGEGE